MTEKTEKKHYGVLVGVATCGDEPPQVALQVLGQEPVIMTPQAAEVLFEQLGNLLEDIGYFKDEATEVVATEGAGCTRH